MKIKDIYEDVEDDILARDIAIKITNKLYEETELNEYNNFIRIPHPDYEAYYITVAKLFDYDLTGIPSELAHIKIIVRYHTYSNPNVRAAIDNMNNVHLFLGEYENKRLSLSFYNALKSSVVHELIHAIDNNRIKEKTTTSAEHSEKGDYVAYANDPMELNAYYHEMVFSMSERIKLYMSKPEQYPFLYDTFLSTSEKFIEHTLQFLDRGYLEALKPENIKKFKKRLYQYYEHIKDTLKPENVVHEQLVETMNKVTEYLLSGSTYEDDDLSHVYDRIEEAGGIWAFI